jgi:hypothetical protein
MNIFLVPYTWLRHLSMAFWCAGAGLLAWWVALTIVVWGPFDWPPSFDGPLLLGGIAASVAAASLLGEGNLRRMPLLKRLPFVGIGTALTALFSVLWYVLWHTVAHAALFSGERAEDAGDASLVSLTYRVGAFLMAGFSTGLGPLIVRRLDGWFSHALAGPAAGLSGAAVWYLLNGPTKLGLDDLYLAGAALATTWGFVFGLVAWGIPDELYAGWMRVLTSNRHARRIPIDAPDGGPKERFIGHFPRGLDLFLPVEDGVLELHVSVSVDKNHRYVARGLSLAKTTVMRFLERIDLRYDPRRPAPLETELSSGDRIVMGEGAQRSEVEFLMLPREET